MKENNRTYNSVTAAKYLLALAFSKGRVLNVTQVQKLLYMAYGYFLAREGRILLDENPRAWPYGPVFPKTREEIDYSTVVELSSDEFDEIRTDEALNHFYKLLIDKYAVFTASQLSEWSHTEGSPWDKTVKQNNYRWNVCIPDEFITAYFSTANF